MNVEGIATCPDCGAQTRAGQLFCKECGARLIADARGTLPPNPQLSAQPMIVQSTGRISTSMVESVVGEIIISACSLAIIVLAALPWYKVTDPDIDLSVTVRVWPQWLVLISAIILMLFTLVMMADKIFDFFALSTVLPVYLAGALAILSFSILAVIFKPTEVTVWGFTGTIESTDVVKVQWNYVTYTLQFTAGIFAGCAYTFYKRRKGS